MTGIRVSFARDRLAQLRHAVVAVHGHEAINELFRFDLELAVVREDVEDLLAETGVAEIERLLLCEPLAFGLGADPAETQRHGVVVAASVGGALVAHDAGPASIALRLVVAPRAALLCHRRRSRIFQDLYPHEIVSRVLAEHGVRHRWALANYYPRRLYCVQFDETDWDFVARLMAEEGVMFFFEHGEFGGGAAARVVRDATWQETVGTVGTAAAGAGAATAPMGGVMGAAGGVAGLLGEPLSEFAEDPELANDGLVPPPGQAGPAGESEVLVIVDTDRGYVSSVYAQVERVSVAGHGVAVRTPANGTTLQLELVSADGMAGEATGIDRFEPQRAIRPDEVHIRDYQFRQPLMELGARYGLGPRGRAPWLNQSLEQYSHHGEYERPDINAENARLHLEQHRADAVRSSGAGSCADLAPGVRFHLLNVALELVSEGEYAVTRVEHRWDARPADDPASLVARPRHAPPRHALAGARADLDVPALVAAPPHPKARYRNAFECVPADVAARPPRPERRVRTGIELATVVGPAGEDIYTDRYGRVKIQFHWDRDQNFTQSSCWVRVAQPWAGVAFGAQFLPRVGMEVVVGFVGGDPDRPVVFGTLFNGTHPHLDALPAHKTLSGIRTQSTPGGHGHNELLFDDAAGAEKLRIAAQRDLEESVQRNHSARVGGDQTSRVGGERTEGVAGAFSSGVGGDRAVHIGGHRSASVGGSDTARVAGSRSESIGGASEARYGAIRTEVHDASVVRTVNGQSYSHVMNSQLSLVGGRTSAGLAISAHVVDGQWINMAGANATLEAGTDPKVESPALELAVRQSMLLMFDASTTLISPTITLMADGGSTITLNQDGVTIEGKKIELRSADGTRMSVDGTRFEVSAPEKASVESSSISLKTNSSNQDSSDEDAPPETPPSVTLSFVVDDPGGSPLALAKARIRVRGYSTTAANRMLRDGETDANGAFEVTDVDDDIAIFEVTLWANEVTDYQHLFPLDQGPLAWRVLRESAIEAVDDEEGVRVRLRTLGYETPGRKRPPGACRAAITLFQQDHGLTPTGVHDEPTRSRLSDLCGW